MIVFGPNRVKQCVTNQPHLHFIYLFYRVGKKIKGCSKQNKTKNKLDTKCLQKSYKKIHWHIRFAFSF